jgi:hypothetical protein
MAYLRYLARVALGVAACVADVSAQPLGVFRWQQLPYCNVLTLNVVQAGAVYQLDGTDDQCGAGTRAAVTGMAFPNPDSTIGVGLAIVTTPGGVPLHLDATISLASLGGTWRDSTAASGAFVFTPGAPVPGAARPVPKPAFPAGLTVGGGTISDLAAPVAATDAVNKAYVDLRTANVRSAMLADKVWPAFVLSTGVKGGPGPYTTARLGVGFYEVVFDTVGLVIPYVSEFPIWNATPALCNGYAVVVNSTVSSADGGRTLTSFLGRFEVRNAAGALTDCSVMVMAKLPEPDPPGSPVTPLGSASAPACTTLGQEISCTMSSR